MKTLLDKSSATLAEQYRALVALQRKASTETQWMFGAELKMLKNAFYVAREAELVRSK